jgi:hypothetical protein
MASPLVPEVGAGAERNRGLLAGPGLVVCRPLPDWSRHCATVSPSAHGVALKSLQAPASALYQISSPVVGRDKDGSQ